MNYHNYYVYILSNKSRTVLYTGITNDLIKRCHEHQNGFYKGFTKRYNVHDLIYYEIFSNPLSAIAREKQIKKYSRIKKEALIIKVNPKKNNLIDGKRVVNIDSLSVLSDKD